VCSPEQLCAKSWLFSHQGPGLDRNLYRILFMWFMMFCYLSGALVFATGFIFIVKGINKFSTVRLVIYFMFMGLLVISIAFIPPAIIYMFKNWRELNLTSTVAYDMECRAVHVTMSVMKDYLDVADNSLGQRILKLWFNA